MSDVAVQADGLVSQYIARVEQDLAHNAEEQDRIGQEMEGLQQRLDALQRDRGVLLGVRQALGGQGADQAEPSTPAAGSEETAPRQQGDAPGKPGTPEAHQARKISELTLVDLVGDHLAGQSEPRSAAEVSADIAQAHPGRRVKATVVRATLEALVAQGRARRTKRGRSVFYSSSAPAEAPRASD
ncbi:hypothetical protein ABZS83_31130 [Streptomyces sp. NPDC005426]|uniref:hypothetical protein n=1 Tax=Streptomyces sp. NPDC005426 TaxID=3155344 RepID=UPI0033BB7EA4